METKSTLAVSKVVQQTNYSAISNLPKNVINQIKREGYKCFLFYQFTGDIYLTAPAKCEIIWKEIRKSDFTSGAQLSYKLVDYLFEKFREDFANFLKLQNSNNFFDVFDQDNDGYILLLFIQTF